MKFKEGLEATTGTRLVLAESEKNLTLKDALAHPAARAGVTLAIGPEGGWTAEELKLLSDSGWTAVSLGPTILRAETAVIAACAIVISHIR
jgi:16S rRNA (uracil1498-N3)-methyltransferase